MQSTGSRVHALQELQHMELRSCGSWALEHGLNSVACGLSCSVACGILSNQGSNLCLLHWQADSTTEPPGKPPASFSYIKYLSDGKYLAKPYARW